jgi:hypothetical protein
LTSWAGRRTETLWLYTGNCGYSGGSWWKDGDGEQIGTGWNQFDWIFSAGDFSGDGKVDILARNVYDGKLYMYRGNGSGGWIPGGPIVVGTGWYGSGEDGWIDWIDAGPG